MPTRLIVLHAASEDPIEVAAELLQHLMTSLTIELLTTTDLPLEECIDLAWELLPHLLDTPAASVT